MTVSDHQDNPFGIPWQRYWDDAPYTDLVNTVPPGRAAAAAGPRNERSDG
jgi:hypothetical protein